MPTPAWSWWLQVPLILTGLPLRKKPLSGSKRIVRMPKGVSYSSVAVPFASRVVTRRYMFGSWMDHSRGLLIMIFWVTFRRPQAGIETASERPLATTLPLASRILETTMQDDSFSCALLTSMAMVTVEELP